MNMNFLKNKKSFLLQIALGFAVCAAQDTRAASKVSFRVNLSPVGNFIAESTSLEGSAIQENGTLKVVQAVLNLDTLQSGVALRDDHMKKKYFEIEKFPSAKITNVEASNGSFKGLLEIHGVSKEVSGSYEVKEGQVLAKFTTRMSDFSIPKALYMGVGAKDEVAVEVSLPISAPQTAK